MREQAYILTYRAVALCPECHGPPIAVLVEVEVVLYGQVLEVDIATGEIERGGLIDALFGIIGCILDDNSIGGLSDDRDVVDADLRERFFSEVVESVRQEDLIAVLQLADDHEQAIDIVGGNHVVAILLGNLLLDIVDGYGFERGGLAERDGDGIHILIEIHAGSGAHGLDIGMWRDGQFELVTGLKEPSFVFGFPCASGGSQTLMVLGIEEALGKVVGEIGGLGR